MLPLTGTGLLAVLSAAAAGALAGLVRACLRRRVGAALLAVLVVLGSGVAVTAAAVNDHFRLYPSWTVLLGGHRVDMQPLPRVPTALVAAAVHEGPTDPWAALRARLSVLRPRRPGAGVLVRVPMPGARSGVRRSGYVYLPPQYFDPRYAGVRLPVVELFHGSPGRPVDYLTGLDVAAVLDRENALGRAGPMVAVVPDTNGSVFHSDECVNAVGGTQDETYLAVDVPDEIRHLLRVVPDGWGAAGYSTGGFCAVNLLLHHPGQYRAAASWDGNYRAIQDGYTGNLYRGDLAARRANSPVDEVRRQPPSGDAFYLVAGTTDRPDVRETREFAAALPAGTDVSVVLQRGGRHVFPDWKAAEPASFDWLWQHLGTAPLRSLWGVGGAGAAMSTSAASLYAWLHAPRPAAPAPSPSTPTPRGPTPTPSASPSATATASAAPSPVVSPTPSAPGTPGT